MDLFICIGLCVINFFILFLFFYDHLKLRKNYDCKTYKQIIDKCKTEINQCQHDLREFSGNTKIKIVYLRWRQTYKKINAYALLPGCICLSGDWLHLASPDSVISKNARAALYSVVGHELGHKDHEPMFSLNKFKNHIREIRCDFCGVKFATTYGYARDEAIYARYIYDGENITSPDVTEKLTHPSSQTRLYCLNNYPKFCTEIIDYIVNKELYFNERVIQNLYKSVFRGKIFTKDDF